MKKILTLALAVFTAGAFAQSNLETMKTDANSKIDKKMSTLKTAKSCVNNASTVEAFKACKFDMSETMDMQKMESMEEEKMKKESME